MSDTKTAYDSMLAAFNSHDVGRAERYVASDAVNHTPLPGEPSGIDGFRYRATMLVSAFPDFTFEQQEAVVDGDRVATRGILRGTNTGSFMGMPATGKKVCIAYADIVRFRDGKMVEHWGLMDIASLMQQLQGAS
jgi:predicted ester cyclase